MKTLEELFYDPKSGFVNSEKLYQRAKEYGYSIKDVREYYKKQELNQLNKQKVGSIAYFPIGGRGEGSYQADLMFIDEVVVLCVINVNTRMAYCYLIGKKSGAIDGLKKFVAEVKGVRFIQTDQGTEFVNGQVRKLFEEKGIEWDTVKVGDHNGQAKVERFNQTLRGLIDRYSQVNKNWKKVFDDLVFNYNHSVHRSLGGKPVDADEEQEVVAQMNQWREARDAYDMFSVGDRVRVLLNRGLFKKGREKWSKTIYTIEKKEGNHFVLEDGVNVRHWEVQKIDGVEKPVAKVEVGVGKVVGKRAKQMLKKEGIDTGAILTRSRMVMDVVAKDVVGRTDTGRRNQAKDVYDFTKRVEVGKRR